MKKQIYTSTLRNCKFESYSASLNGILIKKTSSNNLKKSQTGQTCFKEKLSFNTKTPKKCIHFAVPKCLCLAFFLPQLIHFLMLKATAYKSTNKNLRKNLPAFPPSLLTSRFRVSASFSFAVSIFFSTASISFPTQPRVVKS